MGPKITPERTIYLSWLLLAKGSTPGTPSMLHACTSAVMNFTQKTNDALMQPPNLCHPLTPANSHGPRLFSSSHFVKGGSLPDAEWACRVRSMDELTILCRNWGMANSSTAQLAEEDHLGMVCAVAFSRMVLLGMFLYSRRNKQ